MRERLLDEEPHVRIHHPTLQAGLLCLSFHESHEPARWTPVILQLVASDPQEPLSGVSHVRPVSLRAKPHSDEHVLYELLGHLSHANLATDHGHDPRAVAVIEGLEGLRVASGATVEQPASIDLIDPGHKHTPPEQRCR